MAEITAATLNVLNRRGRWGERAPLVVEQLIELMPDVMGLQEVDFPIDQGTWLVRRVNSLIDGPKYDIRHACKPGEGASRQAIAVITRLSLLEHEALDLMEQDRVAQRVRLRLPDGGLLDFYNTHLHHPASRAAGEVRRRQVERLLAWIARRAEEAPRLVVGDFNALPTGGTIALMKEKFRSAHEAAQGREPDYTWPSPLVKTLPQEELGVEEIPEEFRGTLDYVFVSAEVRVLEARVVFDRPDPEDELLYPSDHFGLFARLEVPAS